MTSRTDASLTRYLPAKEAARLVGLSHKTLEKHRCFGTGPVFYKIGGRILYAPAELTAWVERTARRSTSDDALVAPPANRRAARAPRYRTPGER